MLREIHAPKPAPGLVAHVYRNTIATYILQLAERGYYCLAVREPRNVRMARAQDIVLVDHPADKEAPRLICVYQVDLLDAQPPLGKGKQFKYEPERMLYPYEWLHKAEPAELRLVLMQDPAIWFARTTALLLAAINLAAPHLFEGLRAGYPTVLERL